MQVNNGTKVNVQLFIKSNRYGVRYYNFCLTVSWQPPFMTLLKLSVVFSTLLVLCIQHTGSKFPPIRICIPHFNRKVEISQSSRRKSWIFTTFDSVRLLCRERQFCRRVGQWKWFKNLSRDKLTPEKKGEVARKKWAESRQLDLTRRQATSRNGFSETTQWTCRCRRSRDASGIPLLGSGMGEKRDNNLEGVLLLNFSQ
jgi:hypothetical protein